MAAPMPWRRWVGRAATQSISTTPLVVQAPGGGDRLIAVVADEQPEVGSEEPVVGVRGTPGKGKPAFNAVSKSARRRRPWTGQIRIPDGGATLNGAGGRSISGGCPTSDIPSGGDPGSGQALSRDPPPLRWE